MWERPDLRCSDADRDRAAAVVRDSLGEGRITVAELDDRLERVYAAQTYGDLSAVMRDLPAWVSPAPPSPPAWPPPGSIAERARFGVRRELRRFAIVMALLWMLFVVGIAGDGGRGVHALWPMWIMIPWGIALLSRSGRRRRARRQGPGF